ncbi:hypothetical protein [Clostridium tunisiense]|uniref:hypothetical protein n=1 Tax=Clostridium tunisiense TaxID=219748 RepID=UPI0003150BC3|nr:hypothetical protein [Clostridium tunisiense]
MGEQKVSLINKTNTRNKWLIVVISIVLILGGSYFIFLYPNNTKTAGDYLSDNYKTAEFNEEGIASTLSLIDDSKKYDVFFTGEYHGELGNEKISLEMLKYLNKTSGVNYLICELQYSVVFKFNKYLETGDEKLLNEAVNVVRKKNSDYAGENYYKFWQGIYEYNKTLPEEKKIQAFGIDMDFLPDYTLKVLNSLIPTKEPPAEIEENLRKLKSLFSGEVSSEDEVPNIMLALQEDLNNNDKFYKVFFGENFNEFKNNISSMVNTAEYAKTQDVNRDELIYDNFMRIYKENPKGKYYGQFGRLHIYRQDFLDSGKTFFTFAKIMENKGNLKVLSIPIIYSDSADLMSEADNLANGNFSIFKLNSKGSPYRKSQDTIVTKNIIGGMNGNTTDNYQYVIYTRDK